jgi:hypothetical protein
MAYSKAKLKSSGDKASPCFKPFWTGKLSDKCLPIGKNYNFVCFTVCNIGEAGRHRGAVSRLSVYNDVDLYLGGTWLRSHPGQ